MPEIVIPEPFEPLLRVSKRYKVYHGGRGSAKSWSFERSLLIKGMEKSLRILCAREIQNSINDSVKRLLDDEIERLGLEEFYKSTKTTIHGINGTLFRFAGLRWNTTNIKSMEGIDICWVEEADVISQDSLDILFPTIRKDNSEIWFSFNARDPKSPVLTRFVQDEHGNPINDPNAYVRKINFDENPYFTKALQIEMEWDKKHDPDKFRHVWLGFPLKQSEALVFHNKWEISPFEVPEDFTRYQGADWGFANDPSTLVQCFINDGDRELYIPYEAYGVGVEIDQLPQLFGAVPQSRKWKIKADSARPETISYVRRAGFKIVSARKGPGSVEDGTNHLKSYKIIVHPRCKHTIYELGSHSYKINKLTGDILPVIEDKNNHMIDPLRYALEDVRAAKVMI